MIVRTQAPMLTTAARLTTQEAAGANASAAGKGQDTAVSTAARCEIQHRPRAPETRARLREFPPADGARLNQETRRLLDQLNLGNREGLFAGHRGNRAGRGRLLGLLANVLVKRLARVVIGQVVIHGLPVLLNLDDGLALVTFLQRALGALGIT